MVLDQCADEEEVDAAAAILILALVTYIEAEAAVTLEGMSTGTHRQREVLGSADAGVPAKRLCARRR